MKYLKLAVLAAASMAACESTSGLEETIRYELTHLLGSPLPAQTSVSGAACVDSIYSGSIEMTAPSSATMSMNYVRNCGGDRTPVPSSFSGSYVTMGDAIDFTWQVENNPLLDQFSQKAFVDGEDLTFSQEIYTEENPDGTGTFFVWAVFRRE